MTKAGVLLFGGWYSPELCQKHPETFFVFGDNAQRFGMGGQAIIRREKNALGVATKRRPSMAPGSFFEEGNEQDLDVVLRDLRKLWHYLEMGRQIVVPVTTDGEVSLGRERAELPRRAPSLMATIEMHIREMGENFGVRNIEASDGF